MVFSRIYQHYYPKNGGGWWRRYWAFRNEVLSREWQTADKDMAVPITVFDFARQLDAADKWKWSDDRSIGGYSTSNMTLLQTFGAWERYKQDQLNNTMAKQKETGTAETPVGEGTADNDAATPDSQNRTWSQNNNNGEQYEPLPIPFLRWYGTIDTSIGVGSKAKRSGYAAIRSPEFPFEGANLRGLYRSLEIMCRGSHERIFTLNLKVTTSTPLDIFQGHFQVEPSENWQSFVIPFDELQLTALGHIHEYDRKLVSANIKIESVGFILMDGDDGDFQLDVARIRAVNVNEKGQIVDAPAVDPVYEEVKRLRRLAEEESAGRSSI